MTASLLVPEVVQTSGMDCGPACLTALVRGFGLDASYGRLREMCQTSLDGTSIDAIEEVVIRLGLDAEQVIIPPEHLLSPASVSPGIVVARQPAGAPHFIVLWKRQLGRAQIMDPSKGRRWVRPDDLARELYEHEMELPADAWRDWASEPLFVKPLELRLRALGARDPASYVARALEDPTWRGIATLDASTRAVEAVLHGQGVRTGHEAVKLLEALIAAPSAIAQRFWFARPGSTEDEITVRGCVQLRVTGKRADPEAASAAPLEDQREPNAWRAVMQTMFAQRRASAVAIAVVAVLAGVGIVFETALYRVMFEAGSELAT
ncbi:MAG TPA: cysteine peptidase family C39 domain-containing protein, partial [Kofleriaceae bacterium]|nr:cysteine peptidase family C39 domain-containing protein [Kofleriaceae bacterium]